MCDLTDMCFLKRSYLHITVCVCIAAIVLYHSLSVNIILLIIAVHPGAMENGFAYFYVYLCHVFIFKIIFLIPVHKYGVVGMQNVTLKGEACDF